MPCRGGGLDPPLGHPRPRHAGRLHPDAGPGRPDDGDPHHAAPGRTRQRLARTRSGLRPPDRGGERVPLFIGDHIALQQRRSTACCSRRTWRHLALIAPDRSLIARAGSFEHTTPPQAAVAGTTRTESFAHRRADPPAPAADRRRVRSVPADELLATLIIEMSLERLDQRRAELLWIAAGWMLMVAVGSLALARG